MYSDKFPNFTFFECIIFFVLQFVYWKDLNNNKIQNKLKTNKQK